MDTYTMDSKILMVDDTPKNLQVLGNTLKTEGYRLEFATSGAKALDWLAKEKFDLVLLDIMMPNMNGFEVCERIRNAELNRDVPIIFLTAKTEKESVVKGFELGAQDYITKPFDTKELLVRVKTQLDLKHSKEKLADLNLYLEEKVHQRTMELDDANSKLNDLYKELKGIDDSKSLYISRMVDELKVPLNNILGSVSLLKDHANSKHLIELLNQMESSFNKFEEFGNLTRMLSSLTSDSGASNPSDINVLELMEFSLNDIYPELTKKQIEIKNTIVSSEVLVKGNYDELQMGFNYLFKYLFLAVDTGSTISINCIETDQYKMIVFTSPGFNQQTFNTLLHDASNIVSIVSEKILTQNNAETNISNSGVEIKFTLA